MRLVSSWALRTALAVASLGSWGCEPVAPGAFEVRFVWEDGPPPEEPPLFVFARVEGPSGASGAGQTLGTAGPRRGWSGRSGA